MYQPYKPRALIPSISTTFSIKFIFPHFKTIPYLPKKATMHFQILLLFLTALALCISNLLLICPWNPKGCIGKRSDFETPDLAACAVHEPSKRYLIPFRPCQAPQRARSAGSQRAPSMNSQHQPSRVSESTALGIKQCISIGVGFQHKAALTYWLFSNKLDHTG